MEGLVVARALHMLGVVLWIGGMAFVTLVLLPAVQRTAEPAERVRLFQSMEAGFARQTRMTTLLTGASGFYLVYKIEAWSRFAEWQHWWMHAMVLLWAVFTFMLFVLEPRWLHRWFQAHAKRDAAGTVAIIVRLHRVLLVVSVVTVAGAVAGSHGWSFGR